MTPKSGQRQLPRRPGAGSDTMSYSSRGGGMAGMTENGNDSDDSDYNASHYPPPALNATTASLRSSGGRVLADSDDEDEITNGLGGAVMAAAAAGAAPHQDSYESAYGVPGSAANGGEGDNVSAASFGAYRTQQQQRGHKSARESREAEAEAAAAAQLQAQQNEALKELEEHRRRLQLYVLVCRCVAYPFIAKQPTDMARRQLKITKQQLQQIKVYKHFHALIFNYIYLVFIEFIDIY